MEEFPDGIEGIAARLNSLERRIYALEHPDGVIASTSMAEVSDRPATDLGDSLTTASAMGSFSVFGKAMLGVAGAYLLRALAESNLLPIKAVALVAIAHALAWLVIASRTKNVEWISGVVYACTSALILAPMLWELTLRFQVLNANSAAALVAAFATAATLLGWRRNLKPIVWVGNMAAAGIALALSVASYRLIPFIFVLLAMLLLCEYSVCRGRNRGVQVLISLAADLGIWALIFIYSGPESAKANYPQLGHLELTAPGLLLFAIAGGGLVYRIFFAGQRITVFESLQTTAAFVLAAWVVFSFGQPAIVVGFGILCLVLAGLGYAATLAGRRKPEELRNQTVLSAWSGGLLLAGSVICLPIHVLPLWLGCWAVAAGWTSTRIMRLHLELHALVLLLVAATTSGLLNWMVGETAGIHSGEIPSAVYLVLLCMLGCYAGVLRGGEGDWKQQGLAIVFAALAVGATSAVVIHWLAKLVMTSGVPNAAQLALLRMLTYCIVAVCMAFSGARWGRAELTKIGYTILALLVLKLTVEDLRHGQLTYVAASIFVFAITLIAVPRVARLGQRFDHVRTIPEEGISSLPH